MGCIFKPFVYLSSGTDEMMNLCVYIQSTWENLMQLCRNLKVFSSAEQLCTPSLRHTQAQQLLTSSKGAECHFSMKKPQTTGLRYCVSTLFFFFLSSREDIWKKDKFTAQLEVFHLSLLVFTSRHSSFDLFPDLPALWSVYFIQTCR